MSNAVNAPDANRGNNAEYRAVTSNPQNLRWTTPQARSARGRRSTEGRLGGMKFGSCFFGWLTASGTAVLLAALVTGVGAALGLSRNVDVTNPTPTQTESIGFLGGIVLLAIIFVAYLAGGYVAGRMARFNGLKQGLGVWPWAVIMAVLLELPAGLQVHASTRLLQLNSFPRLPLNEGTLTIGGIIVAVGVVAASLVGALLGGLAECAITAGWIGPA